MASQWTLQKIGTIVIALVIMIFVIIGYFGPKGFFENIKGTVKEIGSYGPDINVGLDKLKAKETSLPPALQTTKLNLETTLKTMMSNKSRKGECFQSFGGFTEEMGVDEEHSASFVFNYGPNPDNPKEMGTTIFFNKEKSVREGYIYINKMRPCVIAGTKDITKNFFKKWIDSSAPSLKAKHTQAVSKMTIYYNEQGRNGNVLRIFDNGWNNEAVNDETKNYESDGLLYKGETDKDGNVEICFIPTNWVNNYDEDGINNDLVYDSDKEGSLMYKLTHGDLKMCSAVASQAIELFTDNDASSGELDCETKAIKDAQRKISIIPTLSVDKKGSCLDTFTKQAGKSVAQNGCWALITEDDTGSNDCGWTEVAPGEVIPSIYHDTTVKVYSLSAPRYEKMDALCPLYYNTWYNNDEGSLLCQDHQWQVCNELTKDTQMIVPMKSSEKDNKPVDLTPITYTCKEKKGQLFGLEKVYYEWVADKNDNIPWFRYGGLELYDDNDNAYPAKCDNQKTGVYFGCDFRGNMGTMAKQDVGKGAFPCPSQGNKCDKNFKLYQEAALGNNGCPLYLSESDMTTNDCGAATSYIGEWAAYNAGQFYHCDGSQETCDKGPLWVTGDQQAKCLLRENALTARNEPGGFVCGADKLWYLCEPRKEGSCIYKEGKKRCCKRNEDGLFEFDKEWLE